MNNRNKVIIGIAGAAAVGAAIGMLLSPDKGSDLRKKVAKTSSDLLSEVLNLLSKDSKHFGDVKDKVVREAKDFVDENQARVNRVKESF